MAQTFPRAQLNNSLRVPTEAALASVSVIGLVEGVTIAYVSTYKAYFALVVSTQAVQAGVCVTARNNASWRWVRCLESRAWWTQSQYFWDPANSTGLASDENDGLSATTPLLTNDEFYRRNNGRFLAGAGTQNITVTLMSDCSDNDIFCANLQMRSTASSTITLQGTVTAVPVGTITSSTALDPINNGANQITVPGFDFTPYVGRILRQTGTSGATAVVATIEQALTLGSCRLSERYTGGPDPTGNFTNGQTVEIMTLPRVPGVNVTGANAFIAECKLDRVGNTAIFLTVTGDKGTLGLRACEMRGASGGLHTVTCYQFTLSGGSIVGSQWTFAECSFNTIGSAMVNAKITLGVAQMRHHPAGFGGTNSQLYAYDTASVRLHGNFHMFGLAANGVGLAMRYASQAYFAAYYYGSGNDSTSAGICMTGNARMYCAKAFAPNMDAGKGLIIDSNDEPVVANNGGTSVAFSALSYPATPGTLTPQLSAAVAT